MLPSTPQTSTPAAMATPWWAMATACSISASTSHPATPSRVGLGGGVYGVGMATETLCRRHARTALWRIASRPRPAPR
jgi:hypothetical protein